MKIIKYLILLSINFGFSQEIIIGKIIDSENKLGLSYANIGVENGNIGTVSDSNGVFKLKLDNLDRDDKIIISYIGYKTKEYKVASLLKKSNIIIELKPSTTVLDKVVIKFKALKAKKIGRNGKGLGLMHYNFYTVHEKDVGDRRSKEMGVKLNIKKDCKIEALNFNITSNDFKYLKFRVNFYNIKNGLPKDLLNTQDIIFEIKDSYLGWYKVDLKLYDLYLEKDLKEVVVAIQWLESEKAKNDGKYFSISAATASSKRTFIRNKAMGKWQSKKFKPSFYLDAECRIILKSLEKNIITRLITDIDLVDHTFIQGKPGVLLALSYYYCHEADTKSKVKIKDSIEYCIDKLLDHIESDTMDGSLGFGVTGISFALQASIELLEQGGRLIIKCLSN